MTPADTVKTKTKVGDGGVGVAVPYCEKHAVLGGLDGGDGGKGGDTAPAADDNSVMSVDPRHKRKHVVKNGSFGEGNKKYGKNGVDSETKAFCGITTKEVNSGVATVDTSKIECPAVVKGGKGGRGNRYPVMFIR